MQGTLLLKCDTSVTAQGETQHLLVSLCMVKEQTPSQSRCLHACGVRRGLQTSSPSALLRACS